MELAEMLRLHLSLCEEAYETLLEENRLLKQTQQPPNESFLNGKRDLLSRLDTSLAAIREKNASGRARLPEHKPTVEKAQQVLLKTLLLDRENEQLLLKCSMPVKTAPVAIKPSASHLEKIYFRRLQN